MGRRFLRSWGAGTALASCLALFAYSPYVFPRLLGEDLVAAAYTVRYAYVMATVRLFGPAASFGGFLLKVALLAALCGLVFALLGALISRSPRPGPAPGTRP
jgi:hypothetical protein